MHFIFIFPQIYYETIRRIPQGEELLLGNKDPIQLDGNGMEQQSQTSMNFSANDEDRERDTNGNTNLGGGSSTGGLLALSVGALAGTSPGGKHSSHSAAEEDTDDEDDDNGRKCIKCDKIFHDIYT